MKIIERAQYLAASTLLIIPQHAEASAPTFTGVAATDGIIATIIYSAIGIIMAAVSFKVVDVLTPGELSKELTENKNVALAILAGAMILGICLIIAAAIAS